MADNVVLNAGSGGVTAAADDIGGIHYPRVKLSLGADGSAVDAVAGAGAVSTGVQRVTLASDDPAVVALQILDNIVSGSEAQVDIVAALPAGDNNIGNVDIVTLPALATGSNTIGAVNIAAAQTLATVTTVGTVTTVTNPVTVVGAAAEDAAASGNPVLIGGRYDSTPRVLETGDVGAAALNAAGHVLVEIAAGAGSGGTAAADDADFTAGTTSGTPVMGVYESSPTSVTDGDLGTVGITATRAMKVAIASGGVSGIVDDAAFTAGTTEGIMIMGVATADSVDSGDAGGIAMTTARAMHVAVQGTVTVGSHAVTNAGTFATQVDGAALTALQLIDNPVLVDDAAFTPATSSVMVAGFTADEGSTDSVDEGDAGAARMTLDRKQIVTLAPHTAGGPTIFRSLDIDESEEEIKSTAGQIYWIHAMNMVATARYLKFYNATAASVTVGTTTPVLTFPIPANSTTGAGFVFNVPQGIPFSTAISVACTTGVADADTGAPGANDVIINIGYL